MKEIHNHKKKKRDGRIEIKETKRERQTGIEKERKKTRERKDVKKRDQIYDIIETQIQCVCVCVCVSVCVCVCERGTDRMGFKQRAV